MKQISSVDLYFLLREFEVLENSRVDNFYFEDGIFYIRLYVKGKGHKYIVNKVSKYIYLDDKKDESTEPNNFTQYLRKYLRTSFLIKSELINSERIIKITFEQKEGDIIKPYYLYLELFANGNIVICDDKNIIKNSLQKQKFKDRDVLVNRVYELPPKRELSINDVKEDALTKELNETDLTLVKFLAIKFGIGGKFAEEICTLLNLDKDSNPKEADSKKIIKVIKEIKDKKIDACILKSEKGEVLDFFPFEFKSVNDLEKVDSFNNSIKSYFEGFKEEIDKKEQNYDKELKKLENRLKKQEEQMNDVERDYEIYNNYGNKIYENYAMVEELLNSINKAGKEKGWTHVKAKVKSDERLKKVIKTINEKNNEIILEFE